MGYRGPKKHLKRLNAPKNWLLDKRGGNFAPRPSNGPHKLRECLPLCIFLHNRLHYALNYQETIKIMAQRLVKVDGKVRTDHRYPSGFMDVITIDKTNENFRIVYDVKGRFAVHRIQPAEAAYKLCRVKRVSTGSKGIPYLVTNDGLTLRYPDPLIKKDDTLQLDLKTHAILNYVKFEPGNLCMITGGHNLGRVGVITHRDRIPGASDLIHVKDANGHTFSTVIKNVFVIGKGNKPWISLPKAKGLKLTIAEERDRRLAAKIGGI